MTRARFLLPALAVGFLLVPAAALGRAASGPINNNLPTISGTSSPGGTVTADPGGWTGTGDITYAYQWEQCNLAGGSCHLIPYMDQTASNLQIPPTGTLRVVVTASDTTGSAMATSDPVAVTDGGAGQGKLKILAPNRGSFVIGRFVRVKVKALGTAEPVSFSPDSAVAGDFTKKANGLWVAKASFGANQFGRSPVRVEAGDGPHASSVVWHYARRYITPAGKNATDPKGSVLGCNPCKLHDVAGDGHGGADITTVVASATKRSFIVTITTPNGWSHSGAVCFAFEVPKHSETPGHGGGTDGCYGPKINNGNINADIPVQVSHPTSTTTRIVSPLAPLGNSSTYELRRQKSLLLQIWSSGDGDTTYDAFPGTELGPFSPRIKLLLG
jgi:hypothetical protein